MKRLLLVVMAGILVGFIAYAVFAQEKEKMGEGMMIPPKAQGQMMCPMSGCPMGMMMCMSMMSQSLVATEDGGVVLLAGCKLIKYDGTLNKVKEVQLEMDVEAMKTKMQKMMKACGCPWCQQMLKKSESMTPMKSTEKPAKEHPTEHPK
jgi:hypothetical protein